MRGLASLAVSGVFSASGLFPLRVLFARAHPARLRRQGEEELIDTESFIDGEWGEPQTVSFNQRDLLLYAVGIGCTEMKVSRALPSAELFY